MRPVENIEVELAFPSGYYVQVIEEVPGRGEVREFARDGRVVDGGVLLEVTPEAGDQWMGLVAYAPESVSAARSGIYSTPVRTQLCVVARGDAHFIDAEDPDRWWVLDDGPVVAVCSAPAAGLLILATPWKVIGVGADGVAWRTSRIAINGISLGEVTDGELRGVADPDDDESQDFVIELRTGHHRGGFPFPG
jgi:hypothetical protein